ncbi:MAG: hypothetical protein K6U74_06435 [Firmicutes bacterium]|nr:hypothetical protein [Bacillota bacterium]
MLKDIVKNLWYSFVSRKMWETCNTDCFGRNIGYTFILAEFRSLGFPMALVLYLVLTAGAYCDRYASSLEDSVALLLPLLFPVIMVYTHIGDLFDKSKPNALYYAKIRISKRDKQAPKNNMEKLAKKLGCPHGQGMGNIIVHNVRPGALGDGEKNRENPLAVGAVADGKDILEGAGKAGKREGVQKNIIAVAENSCADQVKNDAGGKGDSFSQAAGRMEAPALESALASDKKYLSNNDCDACNLEHGKRNLILIAKCYFSGWFVKGRKGGNMPEFVDDGRSRDRKKCAKDKIYDMLDIVQDRHLWAEHNRLDKAMLYLTIPVWAPMALISGGFRAADPHQANNSRLRYYFEEAYFFSSAGAAFLLTVKAYLKWKGVF